MITIDLLCDRSNNNNNKNGIMVSIMKIHHDQIDTTGVALTLSLSLSLTLPLSLSYLSIKYFRYPVLQISGSTYEFGIGPILRMLLLLTMIILLNLSHLDCLLLYSHPSSSYGSCAVPSSSLR